MTVESAPSCAGCGYLLTGLPAGACPECGRAFDPADPATLRPPGDELSHQAARMGPGWAPTALVILVFVPLGVMLSSPTGDLCDVSGVLWGLLVFVVMSLWGMGALAHGMARLSLLVQGAPQPRWRWGWIVIPVIVVGSAALQESGIVWQARWTLSQRAFERAVAQPRLPPTPTCIGAFRVTRAQRLANGAVVFTLGFPDPSYSDGPPKIIYSPGAFPPQNGYNILEPLGNGWWVLMDNT